MESLSTPSSGEKDTIMQRLTRYGGIAASIILIAFGIGAVYMGIDGRNYVQDNLAAEKIVGTPDSTIPNQKVDTGAEARAFAKVMRKHALEATDGQTYAEMPRFMGENGQPTNDENAAAQTPKGTPQDNPARQIWVTQTALSNALNMSYFAEQVALFSIVMGVALILTGIGFGIVALRLLRRREEEPTTERTHRSAVAAV
jgi:hypothetical protein